MRGEDDDIRDTLSGLDTIRESVAANGLRLEPIRATLAGIPQHERPGMGMGMGMSMGPGMGGYPGMQRPRRTSQDEIRALVQRTTQALDKIVKIRESMEPFVDFSQFKKPRSHGGRSSQGSSTLSDAVVVAQHSLGDSHGSSNEALSEGRSTNSTESTSSSDDAHDAARGSDSGHSATASPESPGHLDASPRAAPAETLPTTQEQDAEDAETDDDETFASEDVPPLKEARMTRLQSISMEFHEGLPTEFFMAITRFLHANIELKTRHSRFNFYKDTFTGGDAVRGMIMSGFAADQATSMRYGNVLVKLGFIEHVSRTDDQLHNNKENFYRFTKAVEFDEHDERQSDAAARMSVNASNFRESVLMREDSGSVEYDFSEASNEVHALVTEEALSVIITVLHKAFVRRNKLMQYKGFSGCFIGAVAVDMIRELHLATSLIDAVLVGQALLDEGLIEPVVPAITTFQDRCVFYRLKNMNL